MAKRTRAAPKWDTSSTAELPISPADGSFGPRHELLDLHHARTGRDLVQFAFLDDNVTVLLVLEAFDQFAAGKGLLLGLAVEDLLDTRMVALVKLIETRGLAAGSGVQPDRKTKLDQRRCAFPDGGSDGTSSRETPSL